MSKDKQTWKPISWGECPNCGTDDILVFTDLSNEEIWDGDKAK